MIRGTQCVSQKELAKERKDFLTTGNPLAPQAKASAHVTAMPIYGYSLAFPLRPDSCPGTLRRPIPRLVLFRMLVDTARLYCSFGLLARARPASLSSSHTL